MAEFTDDQMRAVLPTAKPYTAVILKAGPNRHMNGVEAIVWEHVRRNFSLRDEGALAIVCPVADGSDVCGIGIFDRDVETTRAIMDDDPGVRAGVFTYDIHASRSFPGDSLPA